MGQGDQTGKRIKRAALAAAALALAAAGGYARSAITTPAPAVGGFGTERGIARVLCDRATGTTARMRAVVLDLGIAAPTHEVLLSPAHALPSDRTRIAQDCSILGADGTRQRIERFWLPPRRKGHLGDDWAVLMTRPLAPPVGRLRAGHLPATTLERLMSDGLTVDVLLARSAADLQGCRILALNDESVFRHTCRSWAGLSGSPIVVGAGDESVVVGITVARDMRPHDFHGPLFIGVGLAIHDGIADAIQQAAAAARAP